MAKRETTYMSVPVEIAEKLKELTEIEAMAQVIDEQFRASKQEIANNLGTLDEEVLIYKSLMIKARNEFEKAANAQIEQSYETWEAIDAKRPWVQEKLRGLVADLKRVTQELEEINSLLGQVDFYRIEKLMSLLGDLERMPEETKNMLSFLMVNYKID